MTIKHELEAWYASRPSSVSKDIGVSVELANTLCIIDRWQDPDYIRLHAGEMTAQEMRSVLAVLRAVRAEILRK